MILVASTGGEALSRADLEQLGAARALAADLDDRIAFAAVGPEAEAAAAAAADFGAARVVAADRDLAGGGTEAYVTVLAQAVNRVEADIVLLAGDERGSEVGPRLAARTGGAAVNHVLAARVEDERVVWTRPVFGGKALADMRLTRAPAVATLRPGAFEAAGRGDGSADVEALQAELPDAPVRLVERQEAQQEGPRLEEARVVVSGGRGLGGPEGFEPLQDLARALGGAVGSSLAAVDEGWAPPEWQVGQTGKVVSPDLYFAIGISGASQHLAGIGGAKAVVAVNKNPDAPIFEAARLGVIMDYRKLLPALVEACNRELAG